MSRDTELTESLISAVHQFNTALEACLEAGLTVHWGTMSKRDPDMPAEKNGVFVRVQRVTQTQLGKS